MAEDNLEQLVKEKKLPNIPEVLKAIRADPSGKTLAKVQARHAEFLKLNPPMTPNPAAGTTPPSSPPSVVSTVQPLPAPSKPPGAFPKTPSQDDVLGNLIKQDKIPNNPEVLQAIKSGQVTLDKIQTRHAEWRAKNPIASVEPGGKINAPEVMKATAVDPDTFRQMGKNELNHTVPQNLQVGLPKTLSLTDQILKYGGAAGRLAVNTIIPGAIPLVDAAVSGDTSKLTPGAFLGIGDSKSLAKSIEYRGRSTVSGLTFGVLPNEMEAPSDEDAVAGVVLNLAGGYLTGMGIAKGFGALAPIARLERGSSALGSTIKELKQARIAVSETSNVGAFRTLGGALNKARVAKIGLDVARIGSESAATGMATGTLRGFLKGEDTVDALSTGMAESAMFTGFGLVLLPVATGAGKLFGLRQARHQESALRAVAGREDVQTLVGQFEEIAGRAEAQLKPGVAGPLSPKEAFIQDSISKMKATAPLIGVKAAVLAHPEMLLEVSKGNAEGLAGKLFGKEGVLEGLPDMNPRLKLLLSQGKHAEAIEAAQTSMTDVLTKNPGAVDYIMAPFGHNAQTLNKIHAERILDTVKNPEDYPSLKSYLLNFLDTPSAENQILVQKSAPKGFLKKIGKPEFYDVRLKPPEVDRVVGDLFKNALATVAGPEQAQVFGKQIANKITDTHQILKSAITFNKELNRSFIQAFQDNPVGFDENLLKVKPELMAPVQDSKDYIRIARERDITLGKRRDLNVALQDLTEQLSQSNDPENTQKLLALIQSTKDKRKTLTAVLAQQNRGMRGIETSLNSLSKETLNEVDDFVSQIYIPKRHGESFGEVLEKRMTVEPQVAAMRKQLVAEGVTNEEKKMLYSDIKALRMKYKPQIESSATYGTKFGDKGNPYFVRAESELADVMNAFVTAGQDFKQSINSTFSLPFIANIENPRRKVARELGPNNVFEKSFSKIKDADATIERNHQTWSKFIDDLGIKGRSKESAFLQKIGEGRMSRTDPEFLALPGESQGKILNALPKVRQFYDTMIDTINEVMKQNNFPLIKKRDDYFLHFGETLESLPNQIAKFMRGDSGEVAFEGKGVKMFWKSKTSFDPTRTMFGSEKARKGGEFVDDAITGLKKYTRPALERIFYTDIIRELDTARHFAPDNMGQFIQSIKEDYLLKTPNVIDKMTSKGFRGVLNEIRSRLGRGAILFNVNTALQQLLSIPQNFAISPKDAAKAVMYQYTKDGREAAALSKSLIKRDATYMDIDKETSQLTDWVVKKIGMTESTRQAISSTVEKTSSYWQKIGSWAMQHFDKAAAQHAYLTGFYKARNMGATREQAAEFGDRWLELVQNDMSRISQPKFYQSALGRSLGQFSSFTTNFAATIMNDLPNIARTEGGVKAVNMIVRSVAGMSIANEVARASGIPAPFDLDTFIPFLGNYRFGAPGMGSIIPDIALSFLGNEQEAAKSKKKLQRSAAALTVTGGGQAYKAYDAFFDAKGKFRPKASTAGRLRDAIFGRGRNIIEKQNYNNELKKGFIGRGRSFLKKKIRKKVFGK